MKPIRRAFTAHPHSVNETYVEHLGVASTFGVRMVGAGLACLVHGVLPFLFVRTGSRTITDLHHRMTAARQRVDAAAAAAPDQGKAQSALAE